MSNYLHMYIHKLHIFGTNSLKYIPYHSMHAWVVEIFINQVSIDNAFFIDTLSYVICIILQHLGLYFSLTQHSLIQTDKSVLNKNSWHECHGMNVTQP